MPMHDWTRVEAGIYHAFHSAWILEIHRVVLRLLPSGYYSLPEQKALGFGPDVLNLAEPNVPGVDANGSGGTATLARPNTRVFQESPTDFYAGRQRAVVIRHVSGDRVVAVIEIVSPANKNSLHGLRAFVSEVCELLEHRVHLLLLDPFPPDDRNPFGLHAEVAETFLDDPHLLTADLPLSLIAYECDRTIRTYLEPIALGMPLPDMPIYLSPGRYILVPLEATYQSAWEIIPQRWQAVIEAPVSE